MTLPLAILAVLLFLTLGAGLLVLLVRASINKTKWGVNLSKGICPRCQTPRPQIRKPANFRQAMWGGSTCRVCGLEVDKWGRPVPKS